MYANMNGERKFYEDDYIYTYKTVSLVCHVYSLFRKCVKIEDRLSGTVSLQK